MQGMYVVSEFAIESYRSHYNGLVCTGTLNSVQRLYQGKIFSQKEGFS